MNLTVGALIVCFGRETAMPKKNGAMYDFMFSVFSF